MEQPPMINLPTLPPEDRKFWLEYRAGLLRQLAAIEERYGLPRSVPSHRERERLRFEQRRGGEGEG